VAAAREGLRVVVVEGDPEIEGVWEGQGDAVGLPVRGEEEGVGEPPSGDPLASGVAGGVLEKSPVGLTALALCEGVVEREEEAVPVAQDVGDPEALNTQTDTVGAEVREPQEEEEGEEEVEAKGLTVTRHGLRVPP
jgi:hypothetical protein